MTTRTTLDRPLAVEAEVIRLGAGSDDALARLLEAVERDTVQEPVEDVRQVILNPDLVTVIGRRHLAWLAVVQVCRAVCPGLASVVADLAGRRGMRVEGAGYYDTGAAGQVYNAAVRQRFEKAVFGRQLVRTVSTNRVEAVVGPGYRRLSNCDFMVNVADVVRSASGRAELIEATLLGRRLTVRYLFPAAAGIGAVRPGVAFANSEVGDAAVKAVLVWAFPDGVATMPTGRLDWVRHSGRDFYPKLARLLSGKVAAVAPFDDAKLRVPLGFVGDRDLDAARCRDIADRLASPRLTSLHANRAVRRCVRAGRDETERDWARDVRPDPSLTVYDLVSALLREAGRELPGVVREGFEQAAGRLVSNPQALSREEPS